MVFLKIIQFNDLDLFLLLSYFSYVVYLVRISCNSWLNSRLMSLSS